jgi:hypothetical protein
LAGLAADSTARVEDDEVAALIEILNRYTKAVLYTSATADTIAAAVLETRTRGADLGGAYLSGADLSGADLGGAYLRGADLSGAYLRGADLRGAYLRGADLSGAYLRGAYLRGADLSGADLGGADLSRADLSGADLRGAVGLLPDGIVPLQILGTKHFIIVRSPGMITIGCKHHEIAWWREHAVALGKTENYTPAQITEYAAHIEYCAAWMKSYGVDEVAA